ncbi:sodium channel protein Nach-like [Sitophilus oryzae]|uniref:Sodium channel protein Nach-like n=1 Tax=Sitophilus oryzae TaxID=7048 RepID=A0A6J2X5L4_SITOR|nr:sodium channel protein Nach-like [Sitophilus oryzae]
MIAKFEEYFCENSSIHGLKFVGDKRILRVERLFWIIAVASAFASGYYLIQSNWDHYRANPTVVTIRKDYRNWENPFPAATACFVDRVDKEKARIYIEKKFGVTSDNKKFDYYMNFINILSNATYATFSHLEPYQNDGTLSNINMIELVTQVHPDLSGILVTSHTHVKADWEMVLTENGLCFSVNSEFSDLLSPSYKRKSSKLRTTKGNLKCHYLNGLCYARYDSDPEMPIMYYIHSYLDIAHATSEPPFLVGKSEEFEINFKLTETYSSPNIRYLTPQQRNCRFDNEPLTNNIPVYSKSICYVECRYRIAVKTCGCKPFFYNFLGGKVCNIKGLVCLSQIHHLFNQSLQTLDCACPQPCDLIVYLKDTPQLTKWETGFFGERITFRWGLLSPTTKYHRKVLFGFQDLIVSFGGILSLFLGMSFISVTESVFLLLDFLYQHLVKKKV